MDLAARACAFQAQFQTQWGDLAASSVLISIPVVALFLYSSKWLVTGVTRAA